MSEVKLFSLIHFKLNQITKTNEITIEISDGLIKGTIKQQLKQNVAIFLGVPYTNAPVKEFRFKKSFQVHPATHHHNNDNNNYINSITPSPACCQFENNLTYRFTHKSKPNGESEDCLHLNIYAPYREDQFKRKSPVMVWLHGGTFLAGHINDQLYDGLTLSAFGDVVVVLVNYRLGIFGFMASDSSEIPGNMGLHDQVTALKWINQNIDQFGGDPNQVTLFGQGAGANAIGYHMQSPLSSNLFKRAILQSGSAYSPLFLLGSSSTSYKLNYVLEKSGCISGKSTKTISDMLGTNLNRKYLHCLRKLSSKRLLEIQSDLLSKKIDTAFYPIEDKSFLQSHPYDFDTNSYQQKELLIGANSNDGGLLLYQSMPNLFNNQRYVEENLTLEDITDELQKYGPTKVKQYYKHLFTNIFDSIDGNNSLSLLKQINEISLDAFFLCPNQLFIQDFLDSENNSRKVFYYHFDYKASNTNDRFKWMTGALNGDELQFIFGAPLVKPYSFDSFEIELTRDIMSNWVHFAKFGKPSFSNWKAITNNQTSFFHFSKENNHIMNELPGSHCKIYEEYYTFGRPLLRYYSD